MSPVVLSLPTNAMLFSTPATVIEAKETNGNLETSYSGCKVSTTVMTSTSMLIMILVKIVLKESSVRFSPAFIVQIAEAL